MRVAMVDPSLFTLPYDIALARGLTRAGHSVRLHGRARGVDDNDASGITIAEDFYRIASHACVRAMPEPIRRGIKGLDHGVSMLLLIRQLKHAPPDVIHFQWLPLPVLDKLLVPLLSKVAPLVLTVHDTNPLNGDAGNNPQGLGFSGTLRQFDRLIVHTQQGYARLLERGIPANRINVVPHGLLDVPGEMNSPRDPMQGEITFLMFGKIKPYKGVDLLIEAFSLLPNDLQQQARILVVGKPYMSLATLHELARARGVADRLTIDPRFVADSEIPALFGHGIVAAFPYREIEASGVLSIALARCRPVIASHLGNFAESIENGKQGLLVPSGDVAALSDALARMIQDRAFASACSIHSGALASKVPNWNTIAEETTVIYQATILDRTSRLTSFAE